MFLSTLGFKYRGPGQPTASFAEPAIDLMASQISQQPNGWYHAEFYFVPRESLKADYMVALRVHVPDTTSSDPQSTFKQLSFDFHPNKPATAWKAGELSPAYRRFALAGPISQVSVGIYEKSADSAHFVPLRDTGEPMMAVPNTSITAVDRLSDKLSQSQTVHFALYLLLPNAYFGLKFQGDKRMKVIIPVAGVGSRLRPHTHSTPKVLLPVAGRPILDHVLEPIARLQPEEVTFVVGYLGAEIESYIQANYSFKSRFVWQERLLGLGHAINLAVQQMTDGPMLVVLGDTIVETDLKQFIAAGEYVLGLRKVDDPHRFGIAEVANGFVSHLEEKPEHPKTNLAVIGLYYFHESQSLRKALKENSDSGLTTQGEVQFTDALERMIRNGIQLHAVRSERLVRLRQERDRARYEPSLSRGDAVAGQPRRLHDHSAGLYRRVSQGDGIGDRPVCGDLR